MIDQLLKPEVQKFIKDHRFDNPFALSLKSNTLKDFPLKGAIEQIHSLQKARQKIPSWANTGKIVWSPPSSVEQSSSERTAKFKAELIHGKFMVDLAGGMGVDACYLADKFDEVHYVEMDPELVSLAKYNFGVLQKKNITVHHNSAEFFLIDLKEPIDAFFIDPSRRNKKNKRVFKIEDCTPNLYEIIPKCLDKARQLLIKLSPMVDLSLLIKDFVPTDIWVLAVKGEVKEVLCLLKNEEKAPKIHAVDLLSHGKIMVFSFDQEEEAGAESAFSLPLKYIYEPSSALL